MLFTSPVLKMMDFLSNSSCLSGDIPLMAEGIGNCLSDDEKAACIAGIMSESGKMREISDTITKSYAHPF